jgi:hypothetical protein
MNLFERIIILISGDTIVEARRIKNQRGKDIWYQ